MRLSSQKSSRDLAGIRFLRGTNGNAVFMDIPQIPLLVDARDVLLELGSVNVTGWSNSLRSLDCKIKNSKNSHSPFEFRLPNSGTGFCWSLSAPAARCATQFLSCSRSCAHLDAFWVVLSCECKGASQWVSPYNWPDIGRLSERLLTTWGAADPAHSLWVVSDT